MRPRRDRWAARGCRLALVAALCVAAVSIVAVGTSTATAGSSAAVVGMEPPVVTLNRTYGDDNAEAFSDIVPAEDGGRYLVGRSNSTGDGSFDGLVVKVAADGSVEWMNTYAGPGSEGILDAVAAPGDGLAVAGYTYDAAADDSDGWLVGIGPDGAKRWSRVVGTPDRDQLFRGIERTESDRYLVAGVWSDRPDRGDEIWLQKTTATGREVWEFFYGGAGDHEAFGIEKTGADRYLVVGQENGDADDDWDGFALAVDGDGETAWGNEWGHSALDDWIYDAAVDRDDRVVLAGQRNAVWNDTTEDYAFADAWVVELDGAGERQWSRTFVASEYNRFEAIAATADGGFFVGGYYRARHGSEDGWLVKVDPDRAVEWNQTYGGTRSDGFFGVHQRRATNYVAVGTANSFGDSYDGWLLEASIDDSIAATRSVPTTAHPGTAAAVTTTLAVPTATERLSLAERFAPAFESASVTGVRVTDGSGSVVTRLGAPDGVDVAVSDVAAGSTIRVSYEVRVGANTTIGSRYVLSGTVTAGGETTAVGNANDTITIVDRPSLSEYAGANGVISTDGLRSAISDWALGRLGTDRLRTAIQKWATGSPV